MTDFATRRRMMVDTQVRPSDVTKFPIIDAMLSVPREMFVPGSQQEAAYAEQPIALTPGRTVLDARTLAKMLDALALDGNDLVLDIGGGYGYSSAIMARMSEAVVMVEEDDTLAEEATTLLMDSGADNVVVHHGPLAAGAAEHGPYDVIICQGGVGQVPEAVTDQLKAGGRIACIFMQGALGDVKVGLKSETGLSWRSVFNAGAPVLPGFEKETEFSL